ncbi:hypothetical protein WG66_005976 [Moniliophthora roreri]|nr:hypothetical protein WG66_005976 [Moniliophthora roreri]
MDNYTQIILRLSVRVDYCTVIRVGYTSRLKPSAGGACCGGRAPINVFPVCCLATYPRSLRRKTEAEFISCGNSYSGLGKESLPGFRAFRGLLSAIAGMPQPCSLPAIFYAVADATQAGIDPTGTYPPLIALRAAMCTSMHIASQASCHVAEITE